MDLIASDSTHYINIGNASLSYARLKGKEEETTVFISCHKTVSETQQSVQLFPNFLKDYYDGHCRCRKQGYRALYNKIPLFKGLTCIHCDAAPESRTSTHAIKKVSQ